jgi:cysteine desulfuration protein SufE
VNLSESQQALIDDYLLIEDPQERFAAIVDRARSAPPFPEELRTEANRVPGCTSRVWLAGEVMDGRCWFQADAESGILKGVILFLVNLYSGHSPAEVAATEPECLKKLRIVDQLTPTRRNGLRHVRARMVEIAERAGNRAGEAGLSGVVEPEVL